MSIQSPHKFSLGQCPPFYRNICSLHYFLLDSKECLEIERLVKTCTEICGEFTENTCCLGEKMSARSGGESDSEDDPPRLSEHAQAALQEFYSERAAQQQELQVRLEQGAAGPGLLQEDWVRLGVEATFLLV